MHYFASDMTHKRRRRRLSNIGSASDMARVSAFLFAIAVWASIGVGCIKLSVKRQACVSQSADVFASLRSCR
jgi:hypothetical protein